MRKKARSSMMGETLRRIRVQIEAIQVQAVPTNEVTLSSDTDEQ
jgi:hypothetical protein